MRHRDDDFLENDRAEADLRRLMARWGEPAHVAPPPDLVTRMARRLPSEPPALTARLVARRRRLRLAVAVFAAAPLMLVALLSLLNAIGVGPQPALLFGDGSAGISRLLLMLQLMAKPLLGSMFTAGVPLLLASALAVAVFVGIWRWMVRRTPGYAYPENIP